MNPELISQLTKRSPIPSFQLPNRIGHKDDKEYWEIYRAIRMSENKQAIADFVCQNGCSVEAITIDRKVILILGDKTYDPIDSRLLKKIVNQGIKAEQEGIINNCFHVAKEACAHQGFTGRIATSSGCSQFVGWDNHCINWHELDDSSLISFDLTTSANITRRNEDFYILMLHGQNMQSLQFMLNSLYGGDWNPIQNND